MKKLKEQSLDFGRGTISTSVMSQTIGGIGGDIAAKGQTGMQKMANFFPSIGNIMGSGLVLGSLKELQKTTKRFKK